MSLPRPPWDAEDEDERTMHVSPVVLGRVGVFSGDWAIVGSGDKERDREREKALDFRLVRLVSAAHSTPSTHPPRSSPTSRPHPSRRPRWYLCAPPPSARIRHPYLPRVQ
ncbi:hypothetical protein AURDEDRAFT_111027 [Auricularia subglabra TFB-10046 SS5]|nr:hypothetical protein AURDEDRAFT_111027 [Auricularia subglabra TFB-10046 SS5]